MENSLEKLRLQIDLIDQQIAILLEKRFDVVKKIANYKKENNLPTLDKSRENYIFNNNRSYISQEYIQYYKSILDSILSNCKQIINKNNKDVI